MDNNYSLSDLATATGGAGGFGGSSAWILIILFAMIFNGGLFGGRGGEHYATSADVQRGFDTNSIEQQIRGISNGLADLGYALDNKIESTKDYISAGIAANRDTINTEGRNLQMQIANAHCDNQRNVDALRFDMSNYHSDTNAVTIAQTQKILDALAQNKIDSLQAKVNQLEMQNTIQTATAGVVKYPMNSTWAMTGNPFCNCNCNCGGV